MAQILEFLNANYYEYSEEEKEEIKKSLQQINALGAQIRGFNGEGNRL